MENPMDIMYTDPSLDDDWTLAMPVNYHGGNMTTFDYQPGLFDVMKQPAWIGVTVTLYIIVILMGTMGNGMIIFIVLRHKYMRTVTNMFICNLAMADLGLCLFNLPVQLHYQVTGSWVFGDVLCRIFSASFGVPLYVSTLTFLLIAFDRFYLIVYPLRSHIKMKTACLLMVAVAMTALGISVPIVVYTETEHFVEPLMNMDNVKCQEIFPPNKKRIYSIAMFLLKFFFPVVISAGLYGRIYQQLCHRTIGQRDSHRNQRRKRTCKILIAIVTVFMVCWLPWSIFSVVADFVPFEILNETLGEYFTMTDLYLKLFAMTSTCINPLLYGWLNENFRKEIDLMLGRTDHTTVNRRRQSCTVERSDITGMRNKIDSLLSSVLTRRVDTTLTVETELLPSELNGNDSQEKLKNLGCMSAEEDPKREAGENLLQNGNTPL